VPVRSASVGAMTTVVCDRGVSPEFLALFDDNEPEDGIA
jgi:hypothetical protein